MMDNKKALVAMSAGVDSSVALSLMQQMGYECQGVTMRLLANSDDSITDAKAVAERLKVEFTVAEMVDTFRETIIAEFVKAYEDGMTPNPCVLCNKVLKFGELLKIADQNNCDILVTGHYARVECADGKYLLKKAKDPAKDQSYFLYALTQEQLSRVYFPLGEYTKPQIRELAERLGLTNANRKDSQDICFVPDGNYAKVITEYANKSYPNGKFIDLKGNVLGEHSGIIKYTVGQRKGLGIALGKPMYVCAKSVKENTVTLCDDDELFSRSLKANNFNWIVEPKTDTLRCKARIRYRHLEQDATVKISADTVTVVFDEPQRAITPGQSVVLYDGDTVLGGGIIIE